MKMKKLLKPDILPLLPLTMGAIGALLRWNFLSQGRDDKGLLPAFHICALLTWVLTAVTVVALALAVRRLRPVTDNHRAFPRSAKGAAGTLLCALGLAASAWLLLVERTDVLGLGTGALGMVCALLCLYLALARFSGKQTHYLPRVLVTLYLMLSLICRYHTWSAETQLQVYCFQLLGLVCAMVASYQHAALDFSLGSRRSYVFFSHLAIFFCGMAVPGSDCWPFYLSLALWQTLDVCKPRKLRRKPKPPVQEAAPSVDIPVDGE